MKESFNPKTKLYKIFLSSPIVTIAYEGYRERLGKELIGLFIHLLQYNNGGQNPFDFESY